MNISRKNPYRVYCLLLFLQFGMLLVWAQNQTVTVPYSTSFEQYQPWDPYQILESQGWLEEGDPYTKTFIQGNAFTGNKSLKIWSDIPSYGLAIRMADATMAVDISNQSAYYFLDLKWKGFVKSTPYNQYASCLLFDELIDCQYDGIFLSDNSGGSYVKVFDFYNSNGAWQSCKLNISNLARIYGLSCNANFRIKIQYKCWNGEEYLTACRYDKYLLIDDLSVITTNKPATKVVYSYDVLGNREFRELTEINMTKSSQLDSAHIRQLEEGLGEVTVLIHPNPTKGMLRVEIVDPSNDHLFTANMYSQSGELINHYQFTGNGQWPIDLTGQPSGYYILVLRSGSSQKSYKIIKQQ